MPDYQPIEYRLRCHTKRTDLPADVLRDIAEAYEMIERIRREKKDLKEAHDVVLKKWIGHYRKAIEERDEARREVCRDEAYRPSSSPPCTANQVADRRGWDCFKEIERLRKELDEVNRECDLQRNIPTEVRDWDIR